MKVNVQGIFLTVTTSVVVTACSHQQVAPEPIVMAPTPTVIEQPVVQPAPKPYVKPAPIRPAPLPVARPVPVVKPRPAPVIARPAPVKVMPRPAQPIYVPPVKAKGHYRGSIPIASDLRQYYQQ
ncbi:MAG: Unknown protein [uncultured Thiotrichaceae bacterium]|uniref:Uncharacterized protein n=1 Tax=uncultured Thiotrichaceae bacterium TaxID=298394 RepID=A0A6S6TEU6_9GAMM|nr:MAG: Unknown protein [uncultured Thiotrichaceae bacterium]